MFNSNCFYFFNRYTGDYLIPLCFIPGPNKPADIMSFLDIIIREIDDLSRNGMIVEKNGEEIYRCKVHLISITGDIPAVADICRHKGHISLHPCRICSTKATRISSESKTGKRGGLYSVNVGSLRTLQQFVDGDTVSFFFVKL